MPSAITTFVGWLKVAPGPWRLACRAATDAECWRRLRAIAAREAPPSCEMTVNDGRNPDHRRRPR